VAESPVAAAPEVTLIGLRPDDAEQALVRALDAAVVADLPALRIVHGKGTGALRRRVHAVLAADPRVRRFALAPAAQGGAGATIAEFTP
jgi:DNA mismatch repair protein MutS2